MSVFLHQMISAGTPRIVAAYTCNNRWPVRCTIISEQPSFTDIQQEEEDDHDPFTA